MELNAAALVGLQFLGDSSVIPDNIFGSLVDDAFDTALGVNSRDIAQAPGVDPGCLKQCYNGILTAIFEAAKLDADSSAISSVLDDCKWMPDRVEFLLKKYEEHKDRIQVELARIGMSYPHVVDVDWRMDYYIKNNHVDKVNAASYLISLKTQEPGKKNGQDVQFACSLEQLQDLVGKLKDATKCLEKSCNV